MTVARTQSASHFTRHPLTFLLLLALGAIVLWFLSGRVHYFADFRAGQYRHCGGGRLVSAVDQREQHRHRRRVDRGQAAGGCHPLFSRCCNRRVPFAARPEMAAYCRCRNAGRHRLYHVDLHYQSCFCGKSGDHQRIQDGDSVSLSGSGDTGVFMVAALEKIHACGTHQCLAVHTPGIKHAWLSRYFWRIKCI